MSDQNNRKLWITGILCAIFLAIVIVLYFTDPNMTATTSLLISSIFTVIICALTIWMSL